MKTLNERWLDALLAHQVYLLRFAGGLRNRILKFLDRTESRIADILSKHLRSSKGLATPTDVRRLERVREMIATTRGEAWAAGGKVLREELAQLALSEPEAVLNLLTQESPVVLQMVIPAAPQLKAIATARPMQGRVLKEWAEKMESDDLARIMSAIQTGMVAGQSPAAIARAVVGTAALDGADGITEMTRRDVQAVVRTAVNHVGSAARAAMYEANSDIFEEELFVATLDTRTTAHCRGLDGKRFPLGSGPRPPLHYQCRSLRVPVIGEGPISDRPARPFTEKGLLGEYARANGLDKVSSRDKLPRGHKGAYDEFARKRKRELTGRVPASTTYDKWLRGQPAAFQDDVLGKTKGKLFRSGELTLDRFTHRTGDELTLKELAQREAAAFRKAGLNPEDY